MEYIEVFSLLAKAADMIEDGETCVELNNYEDALIMNTPRKPESPEPEFVDDVPARKPGNGDKKGRGRGRSGSGNSFFRSLREKLNGLMQEDDETADDE